MKKILSIIALALVFSASSFATEKQNDEFERGVGKMNSVFIPKGYIGGGLNFSYNTLDLGNALLSLVVRHSHPCGYGGYLPDHGHYPYSRAFEKDPQPDPREIRHLTRAPSPASLVLSPRRTCDQAGSD